MTPTEARKLANMMDSWPTLRSNEKATAALRSLADQVEALREAACALGVIGDGYCFCSQEREPHKEVHEPECRDLRTAIDRAREAT